MPFTQNHIALMREIAAAHPGNEQMIFACFEARLLLQNDPKAVWDLFFDVRIPILKRLLAQAQAQPVSSVVSSVPFSTNPVTLLANPDESNSADSSEEELQNQSRIRHSVEPLPLSTAVALQTDDPSYPRLVTFTKPGTPATLKMNRRTATSKAQAVMRLGTQLAILDRYHDRNGVAIGNLTRQGLENFEAETPILREFARLLKNKMPDVSRTKDKVRQFVSAKEAETLFEEARRIATEAA